jgi:predicted DNA-binding transcriptional regulator YafY
MDRRPDTAARARRLLALLPMLKRGRSISIAELAATVGTTGEQVSADLTTLTMCGVPPFTPFDMIDLEIDGEWVTVNMEPPALERPVRLTAAEARALATALEAAGYTEGTPLYDRLLAAAGASVPVYEIVRTVRAEAAPGAVASVYAHLAAACESLEKVRLTYFTGATGTISERIVHPYRLGNRLGAWYLVAFCERAGEERVFRLDRIRAVEPLGTHFEPAVNILTAMAPDPATLPVAEVLFARGAALPECDEWPGMTAEARQDGTTLACVPYQGLSWLARRVAAFLGDAEVLGPPELRTAVRALAGSALDEQE